MNEGENADKCSTVPPAGLALLEKTGEILGYGGICDHCLGRFFGKRSFGITNEARGRGLRVALALHTNVPYAEAEGNCWICNNEFRNSLLQIQQFPSASA